MKVLFTDLVFEDKARIHFDECTFVLHGPTSNTQELVELARDVDVICMRDQYARVTGESLEELPNLKLIVTRSAGYDHIDLRAASQKGIVVCNIPDYGAHMIAEHAFGLLLAVARNIVRGANRYSQERRFDDRSLVGVELSGKTLGILGTGRIGVHAARIGRAFGMHIVAYDIVKNSALEEAYSIQYLPLDKVLERADFVTIHLSLNDNTRGLICRRTLQHMKEGSILVNTARGAIVVTEDLISSLKQGRPAGAGLDVLEAEGKKYYDFSGLNVVVTPHIAWDTKEAISRIMDITLNNIKAFIDGKPINRVN